MIQMMVHKCNTLHIVSLENRKLRNFYTDLITQANLQFVEATMDQRWVCGIESRKMENLDVLWKLPYTVYGLHHRNDL